MKTFNLNEEIKIFLDDFDNFIEYIVCNKVTIGQVNKFISPKFLLEINKILKTKQEENKPKSTQLSYPLIHLFNNLSVSGKLFREEKIKGGKIILKPTDRLALFKNLNDIEKYMSLIEMLWMDCNFEKLGYQTYDYISEYAVMKTLEAISSSKSEKISVVDNRISNHTTILLYFSYFGLIKVGENKEEKREKQERLFCPIYIIVNPIGLEIFKILNKKRALEEWNIPYRRKRGEWKIEFAEEFHIAFKKLFKNGELENSLLRNHNKFKDGVYTFKVYIDRTIWAKIKLNGMHTLHDLHNCIQEAFDFDNDHMYSFFMDGIAWSNDRFRCPFEDEGPHADEVKIGELDLSEKQNFMYLFDYGDEWRFKVEVYSIEEMNVRVMNSEIVEIKGQVPDQYTDFDDEYDDEYNERNFMMKNDEFEINKEQKSNVIELRPKIGRNDLCYCGSGKKYKNCCMKKDQEELRIKELLEQYETVSDKYFTVKEYIELSGYPIVKFDFFVLEILNITASILYKYNKISNDKTKEIIRELHSYSKKFYVECLTCQYNCLKGPLKNISFKSLIDKEYDISELPPKLQERTAINFFYIEFVNGFASKLQQELCREIDKEIADEISETLYWSLFDYVADNCSDQCKNECIIEHSENAYCKFCTFGSKKLPCPKEEEISYEAIKALETDMEH